MRMRIGLAAITVVLIGVLAGPASAADCVKGTTSWTNPDGGAWKSAENWSNGVPSKTCDAKLTIAGDYGVAVGRSTGAGAVARSITLGSPTGHVTLVDDNSACELPTCDFDPRVVAGAGGIRINTNGALKMYAGQVVSDGPIKLVGGRIFGVGAITAKRGVANLGGLLVLGGNALITIQGSYMQDARATMTVGVPPAGSTEKPGGLAVSGMLSVDGKLRVNGAAPAPAEPFGILAAGKGLFGTFNGYGFADQEYDPVYDAKGLQLAPVDSQVDDHDPKLTNVRLQPATFPKQAVLSLKASEPVKVDLRFERYPVVRPVTVRVAPAVTGANSYQLSAKPLGLKPGKYRLTVRAVDPAGNRSEPQTLIFTVTGR